MKDKRNRKLKNDENESHNIRSQKHHLIEFVRALARQNAEAYFRKHFQNQDGGE